MRRSVVYVVVFLVLFVALFTVFVPKDRIDSSSAVSTGLDIKGYDIKQTVDGTKYIVEPSLIRSGGPPKDGIPSLDNPQFVSVTDADEWIADNELVMVMSRNGVTKVYPLQILVWHEIVNDFFGEEPILVTYCPLCGSGIAYERTLNGQAVEFGTSGKLYNSNLIMYDRLTDTYWSQIDGLAIVGELVGRELVEVSVDTVSWSDFKSLESNLDASTLVLSQDTGHIRQYGRDPYGSYYEDSFIMFGVEHEDDRVHPKTVIFGVEVDGVYTAYRESDLLETPVIEDVVNGVNLKVERSVDGRVTIINSDTQEEIVKERDFWFAWYAFHPDTSLYGVEPQ